MTYDAIGNPTNYLANTIDVSLSWTGRQMTCMLHPYGGAYYYEYNDEGLLTKKTGEGMTTELIYDGTRLISVKQTWYTIIYLYDDGMTPIGMLYRSSTGTEWVTYWFERNLQGEQEKNNRGLFFTKRSPQSKECAEPQACEGDRARLCDGTGKDQLTSNNGYTMTYDAIGNPTNYLANNIDVSFGWDGRQLTSMGHPYGGIYYYEYNNEGLLTKKTGQGMTTEYFFDGTRLIAEKQTFYTIIYLYDDSMTPIGMLLRTSSDSAFTTYYFGRNLQGDVVAIYDVNGVKQVSYTYDAFGNCTTKYHVTSTKASYNNLKYRGYYYDYDLGLYFTQTRLYDPTTGRFISADAYISTGQGFIGNNMYAYCLNDPVNMVDYSGESAIIALICVVFCGSFIFMRGTNEEANTAVDEKIREDEPKAIEEANKAQVEYNEKTNTIDIDIDIKSYRDNVPLYVRYSYIDRLYERMKEEANKKAPDAKIMSKFHIRWELEIHVIGHVFGIQATDETNLNYDETIFSMIWRFLTNG